MNKQEMTEAKKNISGENGSKRRVITGWAVVATVAATVAGGLFFASNSADFEDASSACMEWFKTDVQENFVNHTIDGDPWKKNDRIVVEISSQLNYDDDSWQSRLCVYKPAPDGWIGAMTMPSIYKEARWYK